MAFFRDKSDSYFSLSLDPAGHQAARVFRITHRQETLAFWVLPILLLLSSLSLGLAVLLGAGPELGIAKSPLGAQRVIAICALSIVAAVTAFCELGWFLWVYKQPHSQLTDAERRHLMRISVLRRPSLQAYSTFLVALMTPIVGLVFVPGAFPDPSETADVPNALLMLSLGAATLLLGFIVARRIKSLMDWR